MSKRDVETTLRDILESIERVQRYVTDVNQSDFAENTEKQDAVIRNIEIIGEAVKGIPDAGHRLGRGAKQAARAEAPDSAITRRMIRPPSRPWSIEL